MQQLCSYVSSNARATQPAVMCKPGCQAEQGLCSISTHTLGYYSQGPCNHTRLKYFLSLLNKNYKLSCSLTHHLSSYEFSEKKTETLSANCDFYCIYRRIITIFYRKHEIKLLLKTRTTKKKTTKTFVWLLLQVHFHELNIQRSFANYSSISWFLVASCKAKWLGLLTQNIQQTSGTTWAWRCPGFRGSITQHHSAWLSYRDWGYDSSASLSWFLFFPPFSA